MSYLDGTQYTANHEFDQARLGELTPHDLMRFFNHFTFGTETPADNATPIVRHTSIEFMKKALSYFMPNKNMVWNELALCGNPTKSKELNALIKK